MGGRGGGGGGWGHIELFLVPIGIYNPVCGMGHIKKPLLLIGKSSPYNSK